MKSVRREDIPFPGQASNFLLLVAACKRRPPTFSSPGPPSFLRRWQSPLYNADPSPALHFEKPARVPFVVKKQHDLVGRKDFVKFVRARREIRVDSSDDFLDSHL